MVRKIAVIVAAAIFALDAVLIIVMLRSGGWGTETYRAGPRPGVTRTTVAFPAPEMVTPTRMPKGPATHAAPPPRTPAPPDAELTTSSEIEVLGASRSVEDPTPATGRVLMAVGPDGSLIRAVRGSCPARTGADVEISTDSGRSWHRVPTSLTQVLDVAALPDGDLSILGVDFSCRPSAQLSSDDGQSWRDAGLAERWYLSPDAEAEQVVGPQLLSQVGCVPAAVSGISRKRAAVGCDDGRIQVTSDAGDSWSTSATLPGLVSLDFTSARRGAALVASADCPAEVLSTGDRGATWSALTCLPSGEAQAIAMTGHTITAQVGGEVWISDDAGESWRVAS